VQLLDDSHRTYDLLSEHLLPPRVECLDEFALTRMLRGQFADRIPERSPGVHTGDPGGRADVTQKRLHLLVVVEEGPVQIPRVPVDEDAAEVEYDRIDAASRAFLLHVVEDTSLPPTGRAHVITGDTGPP
jgi:hypothetical protein